MLGCAIAVGCSITRLAGDEDHTVGGILDTAELYDGTSSWTAEMGTSPASVQLLVPRTAFSKDTLARMSGLLAPKFL